LAPIIISVKQLLSGSFGIINVFPVTMGASRSGSRSDAANNELAAVLPDDKPWYTKSHLVKLHFCIFSLVMFCEFTYAILGGTT